MNIRFLACLLLAISSTILPAQNDSLIQEVERLLKKSVPVVSTHSLAKQLSQKKPLILLDTREKDEFSVSHLPQARWVGYENFNQQRLKGISKDTNIIVYCSLGYRSEKIGEKLIRHGFLNVQNLYGGIFKWSNEGRTLFLQEGKKTSKVHPYNAKWGRFLKKDILSKKLKHSSPN